MTSAYLLGCPESGWDLSRDIDVTYSQVYKAVSEFRNIVSAEEGHANLGFRSLSLQRRARVGEVSLDTVSQNPL